MKKVTGYALTISIITQRQSPTSSSIYYLLSSIFYERHHHQSRKHRQKTSRPLRLCGSNYLR